MKKETRYQRGWRDGYAACDLDWKKWKFYTGSWPVAYGRKLRYFHFKWFGRTLRFETW